MVTGATRPSLPVSVEVAPVREPSISNTNRAGAMVRRPPECGFLKSAGPCREVTPPGPRLIKHRASGAQEGTGHPPPLVLDLVPEKFL